jgi:hypothetical protein
MQAETTLSFLPGSRRLNWDSSQPFQVSRQIWRENIRLTPKLPLEGIWTKNDPTNGQLSKKRVQMNGLPSKSRNLRLQQPPQRLQKT